jgi:hypothetical protein
LKSESVGAPVAAVGSINPDHALLVRNPELAAVFDEINRRLERDGSADHSEGIQDSQN